MSPREITSTHQHAVDRYRLVDPEAGRFDVLAEANRGALIDAELVRHLLQRGHQWSPHDGYRLHRHGLGVFACAVDRYDDNRLHCVTFLRLNDSQRAVLDGLWSPPPVEVIAPIGTVTRRGLDRALKGLERDIVLRVRIGGDVLRVDHGDLLIPLESHQHAEVAA